MMRIFVFIAVLAIVCNGFPIELSSMKNLNSVLKGPLHASCKMTVTYEASCADVNKALVGAFSALATDQCGTGEKCLYSLQSATDAELKGIHETPQAHYKDDLTFTFTTTEQTSTAACVVNEFSTSETWYAHLDYGTNYCNLHNLAAQTGLKFTEQVDESTCTQVTTADCNKY